jgi:aspartyl-tRNA(Asn)/glutamyl-tRNA(Gln) amidotransferase subunit A
MADLTDTIEAIRSGQQSTEEVVRLRLGRLEAAQDRLKAFISVDGDRALALARRVDGARSRGEPLGPLAGVPIAVKDNICTTFGATTCGSRMLEHFHAPYDAHVVERLEAAGAIILGKTNLDEFAMGSSNEHSAFFITRNPWNVEHVAGGSSGGSACAVATDIVPAAIGSDTGGSIRLPAAFCGVVGLKPSYGRVSRYGLVAFGSSLDQIGPITRDVRDAALVMNVLAGHDERDSTSVDQLVPDYVAALDRPLEGVRIGVSDEYFGEGLNNEVRRSVEAAIDALRQDGAKLVPIQLPHMKYAIACYYLVASAEASSNLARYDGVHYGHRTANPADILDLYESSRGEGFGPEVKRRIMLGTFALSSGYHDKFYLKALQVRTLIKRDFDAAFQQVDVIASPVAPTTAFPIGQKSSDPLAMYLADVYTVSANLAGLCAISVPCGFDGGGLPIGLQLMGPTFGEAEVLSLAHRYQCMTDHHERAIPAP